MITKEKTIENLEVTADNLVIVRERVAIVEDGEEISHHYEQHNIKYGDDYSGEDERVRAICAAVHDQGIT